MTSELTGKFNCVLSFAYDGIVPKGGSGRSSMPDKMSAWLIRNGSVRIDIDGHGPVTVGPGFWAIPPVGISRRQTFSENAKILSICFKAELFGGGQAFLMDHLVALDSTKHPALESKGVSLTNRLCGILDYPINPEARGISELPELVKAQASFWTWLETLLEVLEKEGVKPRSPSEIDPRVRDMIAMLEAHNLSEGVPYETLEREAGLGRVQIDRLFLRDLGSTPRGLMEKKALERACDLLIADNLSVKELSGKLGFSSASHFCAWFKRISGQSPLEYRSSPR